MKDNNKNSLDLMLKSFDLLPNIVFILDNDFNISFANKEFAKSFDKHSGHEIIGEHFSEYFDSYSFISLLGNFVRSNNTETIINQNLIINRELNYFKFTLKKLDLENPYIIISGENQTNYNIKFQEVEALKAKTSTISKMAMLGEIATAITQEINTPLITITEEILEIKNQLILENLEPRSLHQLVDSIDQNIFKINKLTNSIENLAKDRSQDLLQSVFIKEIISHSLELCREKLIQKNINIILDDIDPNLTIDCKELQISQIVLNLIGNSYTSVSASNEKWIKISATDHGDFVRFKFSDSAMAFDNELQNKLYGNIFQDNDLKINNNLGLSLTKEIIEDHYGKFYMDTTSKNNCFIFEIPKGLSQSQNK